jgi:hypothetical protein
MICYYTIMYWGRAIYSAPMYWELVAQWLTSLTAAQKVESSILTIWWKILKKSSALWFSSRYTYRVMRAKWWLSTQQFLSVYSSPPVHYRIVTVWCGGITVRALDFRRRGRGYKSQPSRIIFSTFVSLSKRLNTKLLSTKYNTLPWWVYLSPVATWS